MKTDSDGGPSDAYRASNFEMERAELTVKDKIFFFCGGVPFQARSIWNGAVHADPDSASRAQHETFAKVVAKRTPL